MPPIILPTPTVKSCHGSHSPVSGSRRVMRTLALSGVMVRTVNSTTEGRKTGFGVT